MEARTRSCRSLDFGRPTQYEAFFISVTSLVVSFVFYVVVLLLSIIKGSSTPSIIAVGLESFLDVVSTIFVVYRLAKPDALTHTGPNETLESRASVLMAMTMVLLGLILIAFALTELVRGVMHGPPTELVVEVLLALPSTVLYLVIGLMQLQMAWILRLRSLQQDAVISILGSVVSLGTLLSAIINLLKRVEDEDSLHHMAPAYRYWWLDEVFAIMSAVVMLLLGIKELRAEARAGSKWWQCEFWCALLSPTADASIPLSVAKSTGGGSSTVRTAHAGETTPLVYNGHKAVAK
jgi:uncharacterized membrane protein